MWTIFEKKSVVKKLKKVPSEILDKYEAWKRIVELAGPMGLRVIKGFHDEALKGDWKGYRSSRLGIQWRVIYLRDDQKLEVFVIEVTPHKY